MNIHFTVVTNTLKLNNNNNNNRKTNETCVNNAARHLKKSQK